VTQQDQHGFGIVGAGVISATHLEAISELPNARLVAVHDADPARAQAFGGRAGCAVEPSLDALLARDDIDVVSVCVPSGLHARIGIRAARAGKHLVIEKPIDTSLAAADALIAAVGEAGVAMTVISQHRFDPGVIELRELIDAGALGRLLVGEAATKWYRSQGYYDSGDWRGTWAMDGGALLNQGVHYADMLLWMMGPAAEVTAVAATQAHEMEAEDTALALIRFAGGAVGTLVASTSVFPGFAQRLEVTGTGGTVVIEDGMISHRALTKDLPELGLRGTRAARSGGDGGGSGAANAADLALASHVAQIADLLAAVQEGREPRVTGRDSRAVLELVLAVYASAREHATVTLPLPATASTVAR
jgi:predicted dehydrogenase